MKRNNREKVTLKLPMYILAGGRSSRFGSDKARALLEGVPLIQHVVEALRTIASAVTVVADVRGKYDDLGLRTIADRHCGKGPLAGVEAALIDAPEEWVLICSCDFVGIRAEWINVLTGHRSPPATAFRTDRWQPMPALFHRTALAAVQQQLAGEDHSLQALLTNLHATAIPAPPDWAHVPGVNTPAELARVGRTSVRREL